VVKLPSFARLQPYALAGGGALVFDPTGNAGGNNFAGATTETSDPHWEQFNVAR
jgi:hypothetical protein